MFLLGRQALTVHANGPGSVTSDPAQSFFSPNQPLNLTAASAAGWAFSNSSGDASGTNNPLSEVMTTNKTITANFLPIYTLTLVPFGAGTITRFPDQPTYLSNAIVNLTASPIPVGLSVTGRAPPLAPQIL